MEAPSSFQVAVIGLGLIGSAAARHLSETLGSSLLAIGPDSASASAAPPFCSHADQARLTRIVDPDHVWSLLAARSISRYHTLQQLSRVPFHYPVGSLRVSPFLDQPADTLRLSLAVAHHNGAIAELIETPDPLRSSFPYFNFHSSDAAIIERGGAGYINPPALITAQLTLAQNNGACILRETVVEISPADDDGVRIVTNTGKVLRSQKALVCAGSYTSFLLPKKHLDLKSHAVSVVLAQVDSQEHQRLQGMPSFIWRLKSHSFFHSVYACPPLPYPDGKLHLKIGGTAWEPIYLSSPEQISDWFAGDGNPEETGALLDVLDELVLDLRTASVSSKPCMVSYTAHGYPYVDAADGQPVSVARIFVAAGGCGASAKSSDEIGRIAALLVAEGKWSYDLDASLFRAVFTDDIVQAKL